MVVLANRDYEWLGKFYPMLHVNDSGTEITGTLLFAAAYDSVSDNFIIVSNIEDSPPKGEFLNGKYNVRIVMRNELLPGLYIDTSEVSVEPDRHINEDGTACLCGPIEEAEYLRQSMMLPDYINKLVIPFLYGQLYFDKHSKWPWAEYSHGTIGVLESYLNNPQLSLVEVCIRRLRQEGKWKKIRSLLLQKTSIKGHMSCICGAQDHIRRCHPTVWQALNKLRQDIASVGLVIDD